MIKKTVYVAFDGEEFEDEQECLAYEKKAEAPPDFIQLFDENYHPVEWRPDNFDRMWEKMYIVIVAPGHDAEARQWFHDTFYEASGCTPFFDLYMWDDWCDQHGDEPTVIIYDYEDCGEWTIFNLRYHNAKETARRLDLVDALD